MNSPPVRRSSFASDDEFFSTMRRQKPLISGWGKLAIGLGMLVSLSVTVTVIWAVVMLVLWLIGK